LCLDRGAVSEFVYRGDVLLPQETNIKQWIQGVKIAMRDRNTNSKLVKEGSARWSNLDALVDRIKRQVKPKRTDLLPQPFIPNLQQQKKLVMEKASQIASDQYIFRERSAKSLLEKRNMGRVIYHNPEISLNYAAPPPFYGFQKTEYKRPVATHTPTPDWFNTQAPIDVSIIVPMFNSAAVIEEQIRNWDMTTNDGLSKEIIYVDDGCVQKSADVVFK